MPENSCNDPVTEGALDSASITLPVSGMFTYFADAPTLVHFATGRVHPVAQQADHPALEAAYLEDRPEAGKPQFVTIDGTIALREQMEGPDLMMVVVDHFDATWPGDDCALALPGAALTWTVWCIRSIDGEELDWSPPAREPLFVLRREEGRFNASVGCNTFSGGFSADGRALSFTQPASTLIDCQDAQTNWEARPGTVLGETAA